MVSRAIVGWSMPTTSAPTWSSTPSDGHLAAPPPAGTVVHADRGSQGGFNWSSQHLEMGGVYGQAGGMDDRVDGAVADEVARAPAGVVRSSVQFWRQIRKGLVPREAAEAIGVSQPVG